MRRNFLIAALLTVGIFFCATTAHAETKIYTGVGEYSIMQGETHNFGKQRAKKIAERDVLEQIYFYIKSQSSMENFHLTKDEIVTITAGLMRVINTKFSTTKDGEFFVVKATVIAEIDPDEVPAAVEREKKNRLPD